MKDWQEPHGDRRQMLVYIGQDLEKEKLLAELESCLLNDRELAMGEEKWAKFRDPFPEWVVQPTDHQHEH
jgi:hypothetical protein